MQAQLFEPSPSECLSLAVGHIRVADSLKRKAEALRARSLFVLAAQLDHEISAHEVEAEDLEQLSLVYQLGGVL